MNDVVRAASEARTSQDDSVRTKAKSPDVQRACQAITPKELASIMGVDVKTLYEYLRVHRGLPGVIRVGRRHVIHEHVFLDAWMNGVLPSN